MRWRIPHLLLVIVSTLAAQAALAERAVVLVTAQESPLESISMLAIRKAYLGIPVTEDGQSVTAVRRADDLHLNEIFMQAVIAMSQKSYERRLLSMTLKFAAPRPIQVQSREELVQAIAGDASRISYMWESEARADPHLKIIRVLWQEP